MSISFELLPTPGGWRMKPDGEIDLSHWELDYRRDRIVCTPTVSDFVLMALGTVLLGGLALVFLLVAFKPSWLGLSGEPEPRKSSRAAAAGMSTDAQGQGMSADEFRRYRERLLQDLTKELSPERKEEFLRKVEEEKRQKEREQAALASRRDSRLFESIVFVFRMLTLLPAALFGLLGALCLRRAIMFFRDKVELSVRQGALVIERPQLFGGTSTRTWPLHEIAAFSVRHRKRRGYHWRVEIHGNPGTQSNLSFYVAYEPRDDNPPQRLLDFADALTRLTGAKHV